MQGPVDLTQLAQNTVLLFALAVVSVIIAVGGLVAAYVFYRRSRRMKRLVYAVSSRILIEDYVSKLPGLSVTFEGKIAQSVVVTKLAMWNKGTETIDHSDLAPADPLRVDINRKVQLLSYSRIHQSSEAVELELSQRDPQTLLIGFAFLDPNQGVIIQLVHTGANHDSDTVAIHGTVRGLNEPIAESKLTPKAGPRQLIAELLLFGSGSAFFTILGLFVVLYGKFPASPEGVISLAAGMLILGGMAFVYWYILISRVSKARRKLPRGFEKFFEKL